ncbi:MAG: hypothetical protein CM1200mP41_25230 [Gammaproteobacteria bacterium]|nr:MAG: hypothetical protein CM1200mP41_25230 [Gammaproteobacteria bacterium]
MFVPVVAMVSLWASLCSSPWSPWSLYGLPCAHPRGRHGLFMGLPYGSSPWSPWSLYGLPCGSSPWSPWSSLWASLCSSPWSPWSSLWASLCSPRGRHGRGGHGSQRLRLFERDDEPNPSLLFNATLMAFPVSDLMARPNQGVRSGPIQKVTSAFWSARASEGRIA